ncbi:MAG: hypothetical protein JXP34_05950, partial [Planctomycetes bacterium]|nr:hypothetical protein [Planctomycetota bacterium]
AIEDVREWQIANARWSNRYYDEIRRTYTEGRTEDGGSRRSRLEEIYRTCIDEAVDDVIDVWAHVHRSVGEGAIDLPPASDVLIIEADKKGRARIDGDRLKKGGLREAIREYAARHPAAEGAVPSVYIEIDDRCPPRPIDVILEMCGDAGIRHVSTIRLCKGPWTSRLYRAVKVNAASLRK